MFTVSCTGIRGWGCTAMRSDKQRWILDEEAESREQPVRRDVTG